VRPPTTATRDATRPHTPRVIVGIQASLLLMLLVGCATPEQRGDTPLERGWQDLVAAHSEWPVTFTHGGVLRWTE
jgi:hypothetical protein